VVLGELQVDVSPALNQLKDFARNERGLIDYHKLWNLLPKTDASTSSPVVPKIEAVGGPTASAHSTASWHHHGKMPSSRNLQEKRSSITTQERDSLTKN
jgi:hypothetical protein